MLVSLVDFAVSSVMLIGADGLYRGSLRRVALVFLPVVVVVQLVFTAARRCSWRWRNLFYRDVKYLFEVVLMLWMFATSSSIRSDLVGGRLGRGAAAEPDDADHRRVPRGDHR